MYIQNILYVDNDKTYAKTCIQNLIDYGYNVKYTSSIKEALLECMHIAPAVVIFDYALEDGNGFSLLKKIKDRGVKCKSIFLCDTLSKEMMVEAIQLKIDSYMEKDENFSALNSQIIHLSKGLNELQESENSTFDLGNDFFYHKNSYHILHHSDTISLTIQEKKLLDQLIKSAGSFISTEQLQYSIGKEDVVSIDTIRTVVRKIRRKTYNDIIINKNGHGYKINLQNRSNDGISITKNIDTSIDQTVLIVKGNKEQNKQLSFYLEKLGIQNETVYTLEQANKVLSFINFDYIITDIDLPDGEGIELINTGKDKGDAKLIILSSASEIYYKEYLYYHGIVDYIVEKNSIEHTAEDIYHTIAEIETILAGNRILVTVNSKKLFEQIQTLLSPRKYQLQYTNSYTNAEKMIQMSNYDLVIVDKEIKDSLTFMIHIKDNTIDTLPMIVLGDVDKSHEHARESFRCGADDYISKPIAAENFILKINHLIEQNQRFKALKEQKNICIPYKTMLNKTFIISKTDSDGIITYANDLFCKVSGYSKEELIGQPHHICSHPDTPKKTYEDLWGTIKDNKELWEGVIKNRNRYGKELLMKTFILPNINIDGSVKEYIVFRERVDRPRYLAS